MQPAAATEEFSDLPYHMRMYHTYTRFVLRGIIATVVALVVVGLITGVL